MVRAVRRIAGDTGRRARVSVIVPVWNTAALLPACLESLSKQTLADIEVIAVNNASPDEALPILRAWEERDPRLRVIDLERNRGVSAARNIGLGHAGGEYIAFVDSDDTLEPDFCAKLHQAAVSAGADIAKGNYRYRHHNRVDYAVNEKIRENKANFYIQLCSSIYRTEFLKKNGIFFPERLSASEDLVFAFTAANHADRVETVDDAFIVINTRLGSASFAVPARRTIISHYRALAHIIGTAVACKTDRASFNHVTAALFALFFHIAARCRDKKVLRFVAAKNLQLFKAISATPQFHSGLFRNALNERDRMLFNCLEGNTVERFLETFDKMQAERCSMLRSRIG